MGKTDRDVYILNSMDQNLIIRDYMVDISLIFEGRLDERLLRNSLTDLLQNEYEVYCGRLFTTADKQFALRKPTPSEKGQEFLWNSKDFRSAPIDDFADVRSYPDAGTAKIEEKRSYGTLFPLMQVRSHKDYLDKDLSTLIIHFTKFSNATAILFSISHMVCDGAGAKLLLQAWQDKIDGRPIQPLSEKLILPPINDAVLGAATDRVPWSALRSLRLFASLKWTQYWNGGPECQRLTLSGDLVERIRANAAKLSGQRVSSSNIASAILSKLIVVARGLRQSDVINECPISNLRTRFKGNERFAHNFYHVLNISSTADKVEKHIVSELAVQKKAAISGYIENLNRLRLEWHVMNENKATLVLPPNLINIISSTEWGSLNLTHFDFHAAASNPRDEDAGKLLDLDCVMDNKNCVTGGVILKNDGYFGDGGVVIYATMQKAHWQRAGNVLGDIDKWLGSQE